MRWRTATLTVVLGLGAWSALGQDPQLPNTADSLKFAVIGDSGDGSPEEYDIGRQMTAARATFPFELVLMVGDNMYGSQRPQDFVTKFERPFAVIRGAGVAFFAAIGNHDSAATLVYREFGMAGERYYTFARKNVRFFVFDTNLLDRVQMAWIDETLKRFTEPWQIAYFHHPLYSDGGRHGSNVELRVMLEPLLVKSGVSVVFAGHDHIYGRTTPQQGITHFVEGSSGRLRKGDGRRSTITAALFDEEQTFMLVEIVGEEMFFQTRSRTGRVVDSGVIRRRPAS